MISLIKLNKIKLRNLNISHNIPSYCRGTGNCHFEFTSNILFYGYMCMHKTCLRRTLYIPTTHAFY